jgi:GMP synthase-like glutamine amidotransferase
MVCDESGFLLILANAITGILVMRIHHLQHVPFEGLGSMEPYFLQREHKLSSTHFYKGDPIPSTDDFDWLIVMGGPMGVHDDLAYPWLTGEKTLIRKSLDAGKIVMGICLGAQLIADVLGAKVSKNAHQEIGWYPIERKMDPGESALADTFPKTLDVFHWHGDTFEVPQGAKLLASSQACRNQGFILDNRVVGLQFHLETTPESAAALVKHCARELDGSKYVQSGAEMLSGEERFKRINRVMTSLLKKIEKIPKF